MINADKYKEELRTLNSNKDFERWGVDKKTNKFCPCCGLACKNCVMHAIEDEHERKNYVGCNHARMKWMLSEYVEPIILMELEYKILKFLADNTNNMYISRTKTGNIFLHRGNPKKDKENGLWIGEYPTSLIPFNKLFKFITWEDEEPYSINDILKNCRVIDDNIVIHKIVDE